MNSRKETPRQLQAMSVAEMVDLFEQLCVAEGQAYGDMEFARSKRLFARRRALLLEMRRRQGDARTALFPLYNHRHPQVRLNVAQSTYALNPERAKAVLQEIAASRMLPWSGDAGMSLYALERGISQLPNDPE